MTDDAPLSDADSIRDRLGRQSEEALAKIAQDLLENPLVSGAISVIENVLCLLAQPINLLCTVAAIESYVLAHDSVPFVCCIILICPLGLLPRLI